MVDTIYEGTRQLASDDFKKHSIPQLEDQINSPQFCAQLIMPVRGSFVNETFIKEQFLPGYLPTDLMKRTVKLVVRIRGIVEDLPR